MIIAVIGPTATGKSELAENLAIHFKAEVLNCDAYQIYIEMNKGTAKPSKEFLETHKNYHFYNIKHVDEKYSIFDYQRDGRKFLDEHTNKNIIIVGGSGLYLKSLLYDYNFSEEKVMDSNFLSDKTNEELYQMLFEIDPEDAVKISSGNRKRLLRALYIYETHKENKTTLNNDGKDKLLYEDVHFIGVNPPREVIYNNINERVDRMIDNGLIEEVNELKKEFPDTNQALKAIGYKEFFLGLEDNDAIVLIKKNTRNYAKRQITFFKNQFENVMRLDNIEEAFDYGKNLN